MKQIKTIRCTHVVAQVGLGYYDAEENMVGEEAFPQSGGNLTAAMLYHPHPEQLAGLIALIIEQAWAKISALPEATEGAGPGQNGAGSAQPGDGPPAEGKSLAEGRR